MNEELISPVDYCLHHGIVEIAQSTCSVTPSMTTGGM